MKTIITKRCSKCKTEKPKKDFSSNRSTKDGLSTICKVCDREKNKKYYQDHIDSRHEKQKSFRESNRDRLREYLKAWQNENREKARSYVKKWTERNFEHTKEQQKRWRENNKEKIREKTRRWALENPEKRLLSAEKRRANKNGGVITKKEWNEIRKKYGYRCLCCGAKPKTLTMDHVIPLSLGGKHEAGNIQPLCGSCNSKKHTKIVDYRPKL